MRWHIRTVLTAVGIVIGTLPASALQQPTTPEQGILDVADELIRQAMAEWQVPGLAVAIVRDGEVVLSRAYGVRDPDTGAPANSQTLFPIASITKGFTSFGAGLLVDEGRLSLDRPVRYYLPGFAVSDAAGTLEISMRDLLSHRAGVGAHDLLAEDPGLTRPQFLERLAHLPVVAPLRTQWAYSNLGYGVASHVVETISGQPWESFMLERVFRPAGMDRTVVGVDPPRDANLARGVTWSRGTYVTLDPLRSSEARAAAGAIYSTADDLARWMLVHLSGGMAGDTRIISAETLQELQRTAVAEDRIFRPDPDFTMIGYGLGWFVHRYRNEPLLMHGGNVWGFSSALGLLPARGLGVAVMINQDSSLLAVAVMRMLFDRLLGAPQRPWSTQLLAGYRQNLAAIDEYPQRQARERAEGTTASRNLAEYAGVYRHSGYGDLVVTCEGDGLHIVGGGQASSLMHWQYDIFAAATNHFMGFWNNDGWRRRLTFTADPSGRIAFIGISGMPGVWFGRDFATPAAGCSEQP